ncbi:MAG: type II toxin-antitoxin system HicB family antitoxin [Chloroflexi bacterium]|nr:type II toxin-antitoxin system HicB family antitoxin [Chloroflexota bacterium]
MKKRFSATIEKRGRWYIGYVPEVPGVNTQGRTLREVTENLKEALLLVLEANKELGAPAKTYKKTIVVEGQG